VEPDPLGGGGRTQQEETGRLVVVEGGSHTAPIERPQLVNDAVARFLVERIDGRSRSGVVDEQGRPEPLDGLRAEAGHGQ